jgi:hypothetical protein
MSAGLRAVYGDPVTTTRHASAHLLAGIAPALGTWVVLAAAFVCWGAAVYSLVDAAKGGWHLVVVSWLTALVGPVVFPWLVRVLGAMQRARFRRTLGLDIPAPPPTRGPLRPWVTAATWHQLGYHALALGFAVLSPSALVPDLPLRPDRVGTVWLLRTAVQWPTVLGVGRLAPIDVTWPRQPTIGEGYRDSEV